MRSFTREIAGKEYELKADFAASAKIADQIADPLHIATESTKESYFMANGIPYQPRFVFDVNNVVRFLCIATGAPKEEMQEAVFTHGFLRCRDIVVEYLGQIIGPAPESPVEQEKSDTPSEK